MDVQSVLTAIESWSPEDRLRLMERIWDGLDEAPAVTALTPNQIADLERRIAERDAAPGVGSSWEEVKARLQRARE